MTYLLLISKLFLGFIALMVIIRVLGKKELASASPLDVVYSVALGDLIVDAAYDEKIKMPEILVALVAWAAFVWITDKLSREFEWFGKATKGKAEILIYKGKIEKDTMKRHRMSKEEVLSLLREKEVFDLNQVEMGVLETNGNLTVMKLER